MTLRASRLLYRAFLRNVQQIERRAPQSAVAVVQKNLLGPENLLPLGSSMNVWGKLSESFDVLRALTTEVGRLPKTLQTPKYKNGTVFRHKQWGFTGLIYDVDPICMGDIKPEVEVKLENGRYQPFYRVLIDDHHDYTHYVAQEWVEVIPTRQIKHPHVSNYFVFENDAYVPISASAKVVKETEKLEAEAAKEKEQQETASDLAAVVANLQAASHKKQV